MTKRETTATQHRRRSPLVIDVMPIGLLDEPLEYIHADHARQRAVCSALQAFADDGEAIRADADMVTAYLTQDLILHHADEDEDLYPAVRRRALPEDNLGAVLARLGDDHRRSRSVIDSIVAALCEHPTRDPVRISVPMREAMRSYAVHEHRHLALENSVVLALARIRLSRKDLKAMSLSMKSRRGVIG